MQADEVEFGGFGDGEVVEMEMGGGDGLKTVAMLKRLEVKSCRTSSA